MNSPTPRSPALRAAGAGYNASAIRGDSVAPPFLIDAARTMTRRATTAAFEASPRLGRIARRLRIAASKVEPTCPPARGITILRDVQRAKAQLPHGRVPRRPALAPCGARSGATL